MKWECNVNFGKLFRKSLLLCQGLRAEGEEKGHPAYLREIQVSEDAIFLLPLEMPYSTSGRMSWNSIHAHALTISLPIFNSR